MVSVLVAVYNATDYLDACLRSIQAQTMTDFEVLCVDDCSTDGSMDILRRYAASDPRIKVFKTEHNSGQAMARNIALEKAKGDIITFLDADDWYDEHALEEIVKTFERDAEADVVLYDLKYATPQADGSYALRDYDMPAFDHLDNIEAARRSISWEGIHGWFAMRADLYKRFPYDTTCKAYSDDITSTLQFLHAKKVVRSAARYYYRQNAASVTHKATVRRFDILRAKERLAVLLREEDVPADFHERAATQVWRWLIDCCMYEYMHGHELSAADHAYGLSEMKRVWQTIDLTLVEKPLLRKFGHRHLGHWWLFRLQNWIYFTLRQILGKNIEQ